MKKTRDEILRKLIKMQYTRNEMDFKRGTFRVKGDTIDIYPISQEGTGIRIEFFGDEVDRICEIDTLKGNVKCQLEHILLFPASHYIIPPEKMDEAITNIKAELKDRVAYFKGEDKLLEDLEEPGLYCQNE